jgi:galactokinase
MDKNKVTSEFLKYSDVKPVLISAPGRINIIGEHTDYNHGFVLPGAIDKRMIIALGATGDQVIKVKSLDFLEELNINLTNLPENLSGWQGYILAIINECVSRKLVLSGFNGVFSSDIPIGAGMSSSAALCCGTISALNETFEWNLDKLEIAKIAQASEHRLGAMVGLMDQFASMYGKKQHVILLDCLDYSHSYFPLDLNDYSLVLINTNVKHQLVDSKYNDRRHSCERVLALLKDSNSDIKTLRDVSLQSLDQTNGIDPLDLRRVKYVLQENARVLRATEALKKNDLSLLGKLMYQSHAGLSNEFEVSCSELDLLVELAMEENAILGARMMGGGFGGCTINLIKTTEVESTVLRIMEKYEQQTNIKPDYYSVTIDEGVSKY